MSSDGRWFLALLGLIAGILVTSVYVGIIVPRREVRRGTITIPMPPGVVIPPGGKMRMEFYIEPAEKTAEKPTAPR